jgi:DNA-binding transcriptional MerR regulator
MQQPSITTDQLVATSTVARELRVSEGTVRLLERRGDLPAFKLESGMRLFRMSDVMRIREQRSRRG